MERDGFRQDEPRTHSKGGGTVVRLSRRRRASHRLNRFLKRRGFPWLWAAAGAILLAVMVLGAISENTIMKKIAWVSVGITFLLIIPFSWRLYGKPHK